MTPLERAARAVHQHSFSDRPWESMLAVDHARYMATARAVLLAIREPSDLMGLGLNKLPRQPYRPGAHSATEIWRALVDAALDEG